MTLPRAFLVGLLVTAALLVVASGLRSEGRDPASSAPATVASGGGSASTGLTGATRVGADLPVRGLDPGLTAAYDRARAAASEAGYVLVINSGYRTPEYQQHLLDEEVAKRGSFEEANRWVFTPDKSMHVQGLAIDVGDRHAAEWLTDHGHEFGLCHTLSWEWWHFEWRQRWQDAASCPPEARDPSEAPDR